MSGAVDKVTRNRAEHADSKLLHEVTDTKKANEMKSILAALLVISAVTGNAYGLSILVCKVLYVISSPF